jgi:hypothetical protein
MTTLSCERCPQQFPAVGTASLTGPFVGRRLDDDLVIERQFSTINEVSHRHLVKDGVVCPTPERCLLAECEVKQAE